MSVCVYVYHQVDIEINGQPVGLHMKLGEAGEAFFVLGVTDDEGEVKFTLQCFRAHASFHSHGVVVLIPAGAVVLLQMFLFQ